jgi:hypothetical protein
LLQPSDSGRCRSGEPSRQSEDVTETEKDLPETETPLQPPSDQLLVAAHSPKAQASLRHSKVAGVTRCATTLQQGRHTTLECLKLASAFGQWTLQARITVQAIRRLSPKQKKTSPKEKHLCNLLRTNRWWLHTAQRRKQACGTPRTSCDPDATAFQEGRRTTLEC